MEKARSTAEHNRHRSPPMVSGDAMWPYLRFALRYRDAKGLLAERRKFGQTFANE